MNLSMIGALGKMTEWELHCRGAIKNGVTREDLLRAIIHARRKNVDEEKYCGVKPQAAGMHARRKEPKPVIDEEK